MILFATRKSSTEKTVMKRGLSFKTRLNHMSLFYLRSCRCDNLKGYVQESKPDFFSESKKYSFNVVNIEVQPFTGQVRSTNYFWAQQMCLVTTR